MCPSPYIDRLASRFRLIFLSLTLAIAALSSMQDATAQSDLAAMNQQVIRLYQSGQKTEAIALAEKTVAIARQRLGADNKVTGILLSQLGNLYRDTGRFADAENALKTAVAILERTGSGAQLRAGAGAEQPRRRLSQPGHVFRCRETVPALARALRQAAAGQAAQHHARQRHQQSRRSLRHRGQRQSRKRPEQHDGGRNPGRGSAVRAGAGILLCRQPRAAGFALGGRIRRRD